MEIFKKVQFKREELREELERDILACVPPEDVKDKVAKTIVDNIETKDLIEEMAKTAADVNATLLTDRKANERSGKLQFDEWGCCSSVANRSVIDQNAVTVIRSRNQTPGALLITKKLFSKIKKSVDTSVLVMVILNFFKSVIETIHPEVEIYFFINKQGYYCSAFSIDKRGEKTHGKWFYKYIFFLARCIARQDLEMRFAIIIYLLSLKYKKASAHYLYMMAFLVSKANYLVLLNINKSSKKKIVELVLKRNAIYGVNSSMNIPGSNILNGYTAQTFLFVKDGLTGFKSRIKDLFSYNAGSGSNIVKEVNEAVLGYPYSGLMGRHQRMNAQGVQEKDREEVIEDLMISAHIGKGHYHSAYKAAARKK